MSPSGSIRSVTRTIYDDANIGSVHPRKTVRAVEGARALAHPHTKTPPPFVITAAFQIRQQIRDFSFLSIFTTGLLRCSLPLSSGN